MTAAIVRDLGDGGSKKIGFARSSPTRSSTDRIDKYNVWALVSGGGTTGQAEALTLAVGKALLAQEPALKPALRRGKQMSPCSPILDVPRV